MCGASRSEGNGFTPAADSNARPSAAGQLRATQNAAGLVKPRPLRRRLLAVPYAQRQLKTEWNGKYYFHKRNELNSQKATGKKVRLAFVVCQLCLGCIITSIQFSPSKKPVRSVIYPSPPTRKQVRRNYSAYCHKCHTDLQR